MTGQALQGLPWIVSLRERLDRYRQFVDACTCPKRDRIGVCLCGAADALRATRPTRAHTRGAE